MAYGQGDPYANPLFDFFLHPGVYLRAAWREGGPGLKIVVFVILGLLAGMLVFYAARALLFIYISLRLRPLNKTLEPLVELRAKLAQELGLIKIGKKALLRITEKKC